jgi:hypothetical protein
MGRLGGARMSVYCIRTEAGELKKRQTGCVCVASAQTWSGELKGGVQRMSERLSECHHGQHKRTCESLDLDRVLAHCCRHDLNETSHLGTVHVDLQEWWTAADNSELEGARTVITTYQRARHARMQTIQTTCCRACVCSKKRSAAYRDIRDGGIVHLCSQRRTRRRSGQGEKRVSQQRTACVLLACQVFLCAKCGKCALIRHTADWWHANPTMRPSHASCPPATRFSCDVHCAEKRVHGWMAPSYGERWAKGALISVQLLAAR